MQTLFKNLGYKFRDKNLSQQALRHSSAGQPSYERLEFLGDSVLNFIIADELYRTHPELEEGELSRLRSNLVNGKVLAALANELKIGKFLSLGGGEKKSGGEKRISILADACEAIIGAIYLDSDFTICKKHVLNWFKLRLEQISIDEKDAKSKLQELLQAKKIQLPIYEIIKIEGAAHAQTFHISCHTPDDQMKTYGTGSTRRQAEQDAAAKFLEYFKKK